MEQTCQHGTVLSFGLSEICQYFGSTIMIKSGTYIVLKCLHAHIKKVVHDNRYEGQRQQQIELYAFQYSRRSLYYQAYHWIRSPDMKDQ
jgi:hypothetical protein